MGISFPEDTMSRLQTIHLNIIPYIIHNKTKVHNQNNSSSVQSPIPKDPYNIKHHEVS